SSLYEIRLATKGWREFEQACQLDGLKAAEIDQIACHAFTAQKSIISEKVSGALALADDDVALAAFGGLLDRILAGDADIRLLLEVSIVSLTRPNLASLVGNDVQRLLQDLIYADGGSKPQLAARRAWLLSILIGAALRWPTAPDHLGLAATAQVAAWSMKQARAPKMVGNAPRPPIADSNLIIDADWYARFLPGDHIRATYRDLVAHRGAAALDYAWIAQHLMKSEDEVRELFPELGIFRKTLMDVFNSALRDAYLTVFTTHYPDHGNSGALWICFRSFLDPRNRDFHIAVTEHQRHTLNPEPSYIRRKWKRTTVLNRDFDTAFFDANLGLRFISTFEYAQLVGFPYLSIWLPEIVDLPFGEIFHGALDA
ncbi:MAG: hypothetical protein RL198_546, partial [Actinomycetota bacterium]